MRTVRSHLSIIVVTAVGLMLTAFRFPTPGPVGQSAQAVTAFLVLTFAVCRPEGPRQVEVRYTHPQEIRTGDGFIVAADRRVFTVMAFLNAVGYDQEW